jgi:hypothetical protein
MQASDMLCPVAHYYTCDDDLGHLEHPFMVSRQSEASLEIAMILSEHLVASRIYCCYS